MDGRSKGSRSSPPSDYPGKEGYHGSLVVKKISSCVLIAKIVGETTLWEKFSSKMRKVTSGLSKAKQVV
jgi:hypothetical protein